MNSRSKIALAAGLAGLLGLGAAAGLARADMGRSQGQDGHGMSGHHGMAMQSRIKAFAERYDTNKDGKITQDEINANRAQWHGEFDKDKDANLTLQEFQDLWIKARHERMVREFQRFDRDGDGKVTLEEYQGPLIDIVEIMDRNGDNALSKDDRKRRAWRQGGPDKDRDSGQSSDTQQSE